MAIAAAIPEPVLIIDDCLLLLPLVLEVDLRAAASCSPPKEGPRGRVPLELDEVLLRKPFEGALDVISESEMTSDRLLLLGRRIGEGEARGVWS